MSFLKRLFGKKEKPQDLPPEFLQDDPPDWLIDLKGQRLPEGERFSIRIEMWAGSRKGIADVLVLPANEGGEPRIGRCELEKGEIDRLFVTLGFSFPADVADVPAEAAEGLAVVISIHHREPYAAVSADCNLAGWIGAKKSGPPVIEIGKILVEIQRRTVAFE
jgi:hypothetical protein